MKRTKSSESKTVGFGYVARWNDGTLGWVIPTHLTQYRKHREQIEPRNWCEGEPSYLCKITVQLIKGKNGKPIMRRIRNVRSPSSES